MHHIILYYFFSSLAVCHSYFEHHTNSQNSYRDLLHFQMHYEKLQLVPLNFNKSYEPQSHDFMITWAEYFNLTNNWLLLITYGSLICCPVLLWIVLWNKNNILKIILKSISLNWISRPDLQTVHLQTQSV